MYSVQRQARTRQATFVVRDAIAVLGISVAPFASPVNVFYGHFPDVISAMNVLASQYEYDADARWWVYQGVDSEGCCWVVQSRVF